jgi:hypothetical protein
MPRKVPYVPGTVQVRPVGTDRGQATEQIRASSDQHLREVAVVPFSHGLPGWYAW